MKKVSIIVPIYNVEKYLDACIASLVNQTYKNIEIILVDDGSPDGCPKICDDWAERDSRIKVIHKPNGGVSSARNAGIASCEGEYIGFADPDDVALPEMFEDLYNACEEYGADMSLCGYYCTKEGVPYKVREIFNDKLEVYDRDKALTLLCGNNIGSHLWDKLYKKELFDSITFSAGHIYEDVLVMHKLFLKAQKFVHVNKPEYYYEQRGGSLVHFDFTKNFGDKYAAFFERYDYLDNIVTEEQHSLQLSVIALSYMYDCRTKGIKSKLKYVLRFLKRETEKGYKFKQFFDKKQKLQWNLDLLGISFNMQKKLYDIFKHNK